MFRGDVTIKYGLIKIWSQLTFVGKRFIDGVNWNSYNEHYSEELRMIEKTNTLIIEREDVTIENGEIHQLQKGFKPLLPSHTLLYQTILKLNPGTVLEIGCGAGDHLANMKSLMPNLECYGIELSSGQLNTLKARHPSNDFKLFLADLTSPNFEAPHVELVFTQAVLMHITERENRFQTALENIMNIAQKHVVLMENWTQHDFLFEAEKALRNKPGWKIYFDILEQDQETKIMVISKAEHLPLKQLLDYSELLQNRSLEIH